MFYVIDGVKSLCRITYYILEIHHGDWMFLTCVIHYLRFKQHFRERLKHPLRYKAHGFMESQIKI